MCDVSVGPLLTYTEFKNSLAILHAGIPKISRDCLIIIVILKQVRGENTKSPQSQALVGPGIRTFGNAGGFYLIELLSIEFLEGVTILKNEGSTLEEGELPIGI